MENNSNHNHGHHEHGHHHGMMHSSKMQTVAIIAVSLLSLFLLAKTIGEFKRIGTIGNENGQNQITVSGKGEVFAAANIAEFTFSVVEEGVDVKAAQDKATEKNNNAIKVLKDSGIEDKDIKTTGYNINPKYDYNVLPCTQFGCPSSNPKIIGYEVSQSITVKVRDVSKAGEILSKIGAVKVSNLSGLNFTIDDEDAVMEEAREKAIEDAKEKAKKLSNELGVSLGKISSYFENSGNPYPVYGGAMMDKVMTANVESAPRAPDVPVGQNKVTVNVSITYKLR